MPNSLEADNAFAACLSNWGNRLSSSRLVSLSPEEISERVHHCPAATCSDFSFPASGHHIPRFYSELLLIGGKF